MSDAGNTAGAGENNGQGEGAFEAISSQEEFDRRIQQRIVRERAKFADYDDLKAQATAATGYQSRIGELEAQNGELATKVQGFESATERAGLVAEISTATGVPAGALRGDTREDLQAHADVLKELYKPVAPVVTRQGDTPSNTGSNELREFTKNLFKKD